MSVMQRYSAVRIGSNIISDAVTAIYELQEQVKAVA